MGQQTSAPPAHPTSSPAPAGGGGVAAVSPAWSRPDDASRQAQLDAMKRRADGLPAPPGVGVLAPPHFLGPDSLPRRGGAAAPGASRGGAPPPFPPPGA